MSLTNFSDIDWDKVKISYLKGKPAVLTINSKQHPNKFLIFGIRNSIQSYNWVEFKNADSSKKDKFSGEILLTSVNDSILNNLIIVDGKVTGTMQTSTQVQTLSLDPITKKTYIVDPGCTLPDAVVTGYLSSGTTINWWSLYWLLNQNQDYFFAFNYDQTAPTSGGGQTIEIPSIISCTGKNTNIKINPDSTRTVNSQFFGSIFFNGLYAKATVSFNLTPNMQQLSTPKTFAIDISPSFTVGTYTLGLLDDVGTYYNAQTNQLSIYFKMNYAVPIFGGISTISEQWKLLIDYNTPWPYTITLSK